MRLLRRLLVALVVVVALLAVGDVLAKDAVQSAIAHRIEARPPGSHATVSISSFPFVGRLAVSGQVPAMHADVTGLTDGHLALADVRLGLTDLRVRRSGLLHGRVEPVSIGGGSVTAEVTQAALDSATGLPIVLGAGTVGAAGVSVPAHATVAADRVSVSVAEGPSFTLTVPPLDVLPCVGAVRFEPGALQLSCRFSGLPAALAGASFRL